MHGLPDRVVAAKGKRDIAHPAGEMAAREERLELFCRLDEVDGVIVVLLDAGAHDEDVGIEENIAFIEADLLGKNFVRPLADPDTVLDGCRLFLFVEGHHDDRRPVAFDKPGAALELLFALLDRDGVDHGLPLDAFEPRLDDVEI